MANKKIPMRQCIGCGEMKPKKEMIRVIKTAEDEIILDTTGRKNGRGAYICPESECLPIPKDVYEMLTKEMEEFETR